jgi:hypothetical protein
MSIQYFAKVVNNQAQAVAVAHSTEEAQALREQAFSPCSRAFYDAVLRDSKKVASAAK